MFRLLFCVVCFVLSLIAVDANAGMVANAWRNHRERVQERRQGGHGFGYRVTHVRGNCTNGSCSAK